MTTQGGQVVTLEARAWSEAARGFDDFNYRQLTEFSRACGARHNATTESIGLQWDNELIALANVRIKTVPVLGGGIAYLTGGPLVRCGGDPEHEALKLDRALGALVEHYVNERGLLLRILPALGNTQWNELQSAIFKTHGFVRSEQPRRYRTMVVDLQKPMERIRADLNGKWRNCLNASDRQELRIESGTQTSMLKTFAPMLEAMQINKGFSIDLEAPFYTKVQSKLDQADRFEVTLAWHGDEPVAGHVSSHLGDTCVYLLGATSEIGRRLKAAYRLQWHAIERAVERGQAVYDLGGIDALKNPGVYRFKRGMGGEESEGAGPFEYRPRAFHRLTTAGAEHAHKALQGLRRRMNNTGSLKKASR